jgi:hypothetical protein
MCVFFSIRCCLLSLPRSLQHFVLLTIPDLQLASLFAGLCTLSSDCACLAVQCRKFDMHCGMPMPICSLVPADTHLPLRTSRLVLFPIDNKLCCREAFVGLRLPALIGRDWAKQIDLVVSLAGDDMVCGHVAGINDLFTWR